MKGTNLSSSSFVTNFSTPDNSTVRISKIYLYDPLRPSTKLILLTSLVTVGIVGFVGNIVVLYFLKKKKNQTKSFLKACSLKKNFAVYIKSLAISDVLSSVISVTSICFEFYFDLFQTGWGCRVVRYLVILFPSVTMCNLLVISVEKHFSTRKFPRAFNHSTVKKMVLFAWLTGSCIAFLPSATFKGVQYDLNEAHYTEVCRFDNHHFPFRISMYLSYTTFQNVIPMIVIIKISIYRSS